MIKFNLSPSSINLYKKSQLEYFYAQIAKADPDTEVVGVYGDAGNVVHESLTEATAKDMFDRFDAEWSERALDFRPSLNRKPLSKDVYKQCLLNGIHVLNGLRPYKIIKEKEFLFPLVKNDKYEINIKGFIDFYYTDNNGDVFVCDWKTSSSMKSDDESFKLQALHYCYSIYKATGIVPREFTFHYLKFDKPKREVFSESELLKYEQFLKDFAEEIMHKGTNINNYSLGDYKHIFNNHLCKCEAEAHKRDNDKTTISYKLRIHNGKVIILNKLSPLLLRGLKKAFSYEVAGAHYIKQRSSWDGIRRMFNEKAQSMDIGFLDRLKKVLNDYAEYNNKLCSIELLDEFKPIELADFKPELIGKVLRPEQDDAVKKFIENKVGIVSACTGVGKTLIAAEVIRRLKVKTLFLCDTLELVAQAKNEFEDVLEQEIGVVGGGEKNINEWITVSTIQSIARSPALFADLLRNVQLVVIDECHTAASKSFVNVLKLCVNARYRLGLSATPYRNDGNDMLMESIIGKTVCEITTADAQDKNYLVKAKIVFHHSPLVDDIKNFREDYELNIVTNEGRNKIIVDEAREMLMRVSKKGVLILTKTIRHGEILKELLPGSIHVHGSINKDLREKTWEKLRSGASLIVIATNKIASKGLNIPPLTKIINAGADGNKSASVQTLGRVLRLFDDKTEGIYIDFLDHGAYSKKWSRVRFEALKEQGHEIETKEVTRLAFDGVHLV